ncbi:MAG: 4Fe-4S binding protein [Nanoarchaeota archaeon]|nr:4Fe-4S binding protein [Nanoarchaeota archaeon]
MTKGKKLENILSIKPKDNFEELCSGCGTCEAFCHAAHYDTEGKKKSAIKISGENFPVPGGYKCNVCNQCGICAKECPSDAIYKDKMIWKIDYDKCDGCSDLEFPICVDKCPTDSTHSHPDEEYPIKCDGCGECVEICPLGALEYKTKQRVVGK